MLQYKANCPARVCCVVPHEEQNSKSTFKTTLPTSVKMLLLHHERGKKKKNPVAFATHLATGADEMGLRCLCPSSGKTTFAVQRGGGGGRRPSLLRQTPPLTRAWHTTFAEVPVPQLWIPAHFHSSFPTGADSLRSFGPLRRYFGKDLIGNGKLSGANELQQPWWLTSYLSAPRNFEARADRRRGQFLRGYQQAASWPGGGQTPLPPTGRPAFPPRSAPSRGASRAPPPPPPAETAAPGRRGCLTYPE